MKLRYYVILRLILAVPTILILLTTVFFLMHVLPGDPVKIMYGEKYPEQYLDEIRVNLGLDRPLYTQYLDYLGKFFTGDFGVSFRFKVPVIEKVKDSFPTTLEVAFGGLILSTLLGVPLGIFSALRRGGIIDNTIRVLSLWLHSAPSFWLALVFQIFFGLMLNLLPISGRTPPGFYLQRVTGLLVLDSILTLNLGAFVQSVRYLILPCLTIAISSIPMLSRVSRAAMLNVLGEDYIVTARAKGLPSWVINYRHALRNALLPVITMLGGSLTGMLGGTVITERIFSLPGMGGLLMEALTGRDFDMIQGVVAIYAIIVVIMNTAMDVVYATADPRIKY